MRQPIILLFCASVVAFFGVLTTVYSQSGGGSVILDARVPGCGDGVIDVGEDCDTLNLNSKTCATQGFGSGTLSCTAACTFNTSSCVVSSGGGGGGTRVNKAQVVLTGRAYPKSTVTVLKDAQVVATTVADADARFQVNIAGLSSGSYTFSLRSEDVKGLRSPLISFPVSLTRGILAKIENIFIAPTLGVDKIEVKKGDRITLFGQSTPASEITLELNSNEQTFLKTNTDGSGVYVYNVDTSSLERGQYYSKSRSTLTSATSPYSTEVRFLVGDKNTPSLSTACPVKGDLNIDCKVNLIDFSIVAFWFMKPLSPAFVVREKDRLNGDGKVTLTDLSIVAFYWTG